MLLTIAVAAGWWPVSLDHRIAHALPGSHATGASSVLLAVASALTTLATPQAIVVLTLLMAGWLARRERNTDALRCIGVPVVALTGSVLAGKALLHRPGPLDSHLNHLLGYYPSGHTATALVCTCMLIRLAAVRRPDLIRPMRVCSAIWTLLVGTSLVLHRYHWLSDVVAGALLGSLILLLTRPDPPDGAAARPVAAAAT